MKTKHEGVGTQAHYNNFAIEPIDYIVQNGLDFMEGSVVKYVTRYKFKNGVEDLKKARQFIDWLIEREQSRTSYDDVKNAEEEVRRELERRVEDLLSRTSQHVDPSRPHIVQPHEDDFEEAPEPRIKVGRRYRVTEDKPCYAEVLKNDIVTVAQIVAPGDSFRVHDWKGRSWHVRSEHLGEEVPDALHMEVSDE